ncbi:MAG: metallophosphoesterase, partial [Saprospiraceae bacterium]
QTNGPLLSILRAVIFISYLAKLPILFFMLLDDIRRLFLLVYKSAGGQGGFSPGRSKFISQMALIVAALPFASLIYGMIRNPYRYTLFKEKIPIKDLPDGLVGLKIVQISDIHSGSFLYKDPIHNGVDLINREKPDIVFFTGDLVNNRSDEMLPYIDIFKKIESKYGVFSILGNHDYGDYVQWDTPAAKVANLEELKGIHKQLGWDLLLNENRIIDIGGAKLAVLGVENYSAWKRFPKYGRLDEAYQGTEASDLKILLSHDPSHWDLEIRTPKYQDIALTLAGHTHGFQFGFEIPGFKWSPAEYFYKQWAGLYTEAKQHLYINRGFGTLGYPGRVGILPEVTVLELAKA